METCTDFAALVARLLAAPRKGRRRLIALAGPPASGKSTLATDLAAAFSDRAIASQVVPMDGFHLDNRVLDARGLRHRKGAPETFDASGFQALMQRLAGGAEVVFPLFDRALDMAIAGAGVVEPECDTVIVEGNYLLLDAPVWRDLHPLWDITVLLGVADDVLRERLIARWRHHGLPADEAQRRADENDMPNAARVAASMMPHDVTFESSE